MKIFFSVTDNEAKAANVITLHKFFQTSFVFANKTRKITCRGAPQKTWLERLVRDKDTVHCLGPALWKPACRCGLLLQCVLPCQSHILPTLGATWKVASTQPYSLTAFIPPPPAELGEGRKAFIPFPSLAGGGENGLSPQPTAFLPSPSLAGEGEKGLSHPYPALLLGEGLYWHPILT